MRTRASTLTTAAQRESANGETIEMIGVFFLATVQRDGKVSWAKYT